MFSERMSSRAIALEFVTLHNFHFTNTGKTKKYLRKKLKVINQQM